MLIGALVAGLICMAGVWGASWFYAPLGLTALLAAALLAATWARRRLRTHDPPTFVAAACVGAAFLVAFAVLCELFAEIEHVRGYGSTQSPPTMYETQSLERMWQRGILPLLRPRVPRPKPHRPVGFTASNTY